ncbi:hypothetical protein Moror_13345 [Moniliophthora roreri MCA 2997]|uniref:Uncharacterized protein n=1 Tax=Moniliophthora roreri (strain MCA 2997) TaxID=1381753 RepID=V2WWL3_MONRO|nr:hypothetical protein Moror_13345 [Moniliophthora roreri MCA 2997]
MAHSHTRKNAKSSTTHLSHNLIIPCQQITKQIYVKLTAAQKKACHNEAKRKQLAIKHDMKDWLNEIDKKAKALAVTYQRSQHYFLNMLFQNEITEGLRVEGGEEPMNVEEIVDVFGYKYDALSDHNKEAIVKEYKARCQEEQVAKIQFLTPKSHIRSAAELISATVELLKVAKLQCGIKAMFLMVQSDPQPFMEPKWFFTNPNWNEFLKIITHYE